MHDLDFKVFIQEVWFFFFFPAVEGCKRFLFFFFSPLQLWKRKKPLCMVHSLQECKVDTNVERPLPFETAAGRGQFK